MTNFDPFKFFHKIVDRLPTHEKDRAALHQELNEAVEPAPEKEGENG